MVQPEDHEGRKTVVSADAMHAVLNAWDVDPIISEPVQPVAIDSREASQPPVNHREHVGRA